MAEPEPTPAPVAERGATHRPSARMQVVAEPSSRVGDWFRRYGPAELLGICTALLAARLASVAGAPLVAIAYAGAVGENVGFYGTIIARQVAADRRRAAAAGERYRGMHLWSTARELVLEFGPAELLDSFLVRPLAMGLGVRLLGQTAGIVAGKLAADVSFYLPVILTYEMRRQAGKRA
jgi:hypothetical protein